MANENLLELINSKLQTDANGLKVSITADVRVDIDETSLATAAQLTTTNASLASIDGKLPAGMASSAKQDTTITALTSIDAHVDGLEASASSIDTKLTGVASGAKQDTGNTTLASMLTALAALATAATAAKQDTINASLTSIDGHLTDGTQKTQLATTTATPAVQNLSLGTTGATQFAAAACTRGCYIEALSTNTVSVFVGPAGVTTGTGLELQAGDREFFPSDNASRWYAITGTTTQNVRLLAI